MGWGHSNIDRLTAIWQSLNPEKWFDDVSKPWLSRYLTPFHKDEKGKFFMSKDVKDWRSLGYEYSITEKGRTSDDIINDIIDLYGNQTVVPYNVTNLGSFDNKGDHILSVKYNRWAFPSTSHIEDIPYIDSVLDTLWEEALSRSTSSSGMLMIMTTMIRTQRIS